MKERLTELLVRKTVESRRNAQAAVENWRKAVDAALRAAKQAEYELALPSALTKPVSGVAKEFPMANHVSAVGIAARAVLACHDVTKIATDGLEKELKSRGEDAKAAHRQLAGLKKVYEEEKGQANSQKSKAQTPFAFYTPPVLPEAPRFGEGARVGCGLGIVIYIVLLLVSFVPPVGNMKFNTPVGLIFALALLVVQVGWLIVPIWNSFSHAIRRRRLEAEARSKSKAEASASLAQAEKMLAEAEKEYKAHLPTCERAVEQADQRVQKAESALKWFRAQA